MIWFMGWRGADPVTHRSYDMTNQIRNTYTISYIRSGKLFTTSARSYGQALQFVAQFGGRVWCDRTRKLVA